MPVPSQVHRVQAAMPRRTSPALDFLRQAMLKQGTKLIMLPRIVMFLQLSEQRKEMLQIRNNHRRRSGRRKSPTSKRLQPGYSQRAVRQIGNGTLQAARIYDGGLGPPSLESAISMRQIVASDINSSLQGSMLCFAPLTRCCNLFPQHAQRKWLLQQYCPRP